MNDNFEFGRKIRQVLDRGASDLGIDTAKRLHEARQAALDHQRVAVHGLQLANIGHFLTEAIHGHGRMLAAILALTIGATGTYYWNQFLEAAEYEEIDSALLADDLPPAAYLDRGFHAWLERS